jgi:hypothetical protein
MSASNPQHEPTMEEILASIRKIISEDQPEPAKPNAAEPAAAPKSVPPFEPEVFDLTEEVKDEAPVANPPCLPRGISKTMSRSRISRNRRKLRKRASP